MIKAFVSVVVPSFKMGHIIDKALESISVQSSLSWELIVVDDFGPQDGTEDVVQKFAQTHPDHRVKYIRHKNNAGVSGARNSGIKEAQGKYIAFLDADDWWLVKHLEKSVRLFSDDPAVGIVTGPVQYFDEVRGTGRRWEFPDWLIGQFPASLASNCFIQPSATLVRTDLLQQAGGFNTSKELEHIEDYDLWIRLVEMGAKFAFRDEITCVYRRHPGAASMDSERMARLHQNLVQKHSLFFLSSQRVLLQSLMHRSGNMDLLMRNPLFQAYASLFQVFRKIKRKLFAKPPA